MANRDQFKEVSDTTQEPVRGNLFFRILKVSDTLLKMACDPKRAIESFEQAPFLRIENEALKRIALIDAKTGLRNARAFNERIKTTISEIFRYNWMGHDRPRFALLVLDLDGFKQLNDALGHQVGDEALKEMADILIEHTRPSDYVARIGGDEFAIIFQFDDKIGNIETITRKIRNAMHPPDRKGVVFYDDAGTPYPVDLSMGMVYFHDILPQNFGYEGQNMTPEELEEYAVQIFEEADGLMYMDKNGYPPKAADDPALPKNRRLAALVDRYNSVRGVDQGPQAPG